MNFLKTTILGGLLVLLPILLLALALNEVFDLVVALAMPLADLFPEETFARVQMPAVVAILLIVGASFLAGLAARSAIVRAVGQKLDRNVLARVPMYRALKGLTAALTDARAETFRPALLLHGADEAEPAYVIERFGDGRVALLLPWAPAAFAGSLRIVPENRVKLLEVNLDQFSRAISQFGVGLSELVSDPPADPGPG